MTSETDPSAAAVLAVVIWACVLGLSAWLLGDKMRPAMTAWLATLS
jgi:hypothetical protein